MERPKIVRAAPVNASRSVRNINGSQATAGCLWTCGQFTDSPGCSRTQSANHTHHTRLADWFCTYLVPKVIEEDVVPLLGKLARSAAGRATHDEITNDLLCDIDPVITSSQSKLDSKSQATIPCGIPHVVRIVRECRIDRRHVCSVVLVNLHAHGITEGLVAPDFQGVLVVHAVGQKGGALISLVASCATACLSEFRPGRIKL